MLRPETLGKETAEDAHRRELHQRYVERFSVSATDTGKPAPVAKPAPEPSTADQQAASAEPVGPVERDTYIDIYGNSPFMQHFLLTHNCFPPSSQKSSRINFAAYYAAMPNSAILASDSVQINDALIDKYNELADKTGKHITVSRKYAKDVKAKLVAHRDQALATSAHDYSSRIVSIVAQREQQQRKDLAQQLGRRAVSGQGAGKVSKGKGGKGKGAKGGAGGAGAEGPAGPGLVNTIKIPGMPAAALSPSKATSAAAAVGGSNSSTAAPELPRMELPKAFGEAQAGESRAKRAERASRWQQERRQARDAQVDVIYPLNPRER